jgi:hypothetical protein
VDFDVGAGLTSFCPGSCDFGWYFGDFADFG